MARRASSRRGARSKRRPNRRTHMWSKRARICWLRALMAAPRERPFARKGARSRRRAASRRWRRARRRVASSRRSAMRVAETRAGAASTSRRIVASCARGQCGAARRCEVCVGEHVAEGIHGVRTIVAQEHAAARMIARPGVSRNRAIVLLLRERAEHLESRGVPPDAQRELEEPDSLVRRGEALGGGQDIVRTRRLLRGPRVRLRFLAPSREEGPVRPHALVREELRRLEEGRSRLRRIVKEGEER